MQIKTLLSSLLVLTASSLLTSCGGQDGINTDLLNMAVTDGGIILRTDAQSCSDMMASTSTDGTITRSLTAPVLTFQNFQIQWLPTDYDLYIGALQITVIGSSISGGQQILQLDASEVENLLGAPGATLSHTATNLGAYTSRNTSKGKNAAGNNYYPCSLSVSGVAFKSSGSSSGSTNFPPTNTTVSVEIEIIGTATSNADSSAKPKTVMKTIRTTATFY